jgi:hypothetical protein
VGTLGAFVPPLSGSPHVAIEPSALRAAKARSERAFAALKADGSIMSWGDLKSGIHHQCYHPLHNQQQQGWSLYMYWIL